MPQWQQHQPQKSIASGKFNNKTWNAVQQRREQARHEIILTIPEANSETKEQLAQQTHAEITNKLQQTVESQIKENFATIQAKAQKQGYPHTLQLGRRSGTTAQFTMGQKLQRPHGASAKIRDPT